MLREILLSLLLWTATLPALATGDVQSLIDAGNRQWWSEGKTDEAEASFKQALALAPDSARAHSRLGSLYLVMNRGDEAIAAYQEAIMRDAQDPRLFVAIGIAYLHRQRYGMARDMAEEALRLDPGLAAALKMKQYTEAKQAALAGSAQGASPAAGPAGHP